MMESLPPKERMCHRCAFDKSCRALVVDGGCGRWSRVDGINPQNGEHVEKWACVDDLMPMLLLEISQQVRQGGAATESMRNEIVKRMDATRVDEIPAIPRARARLLEGS